METTFTPVAGLIGGALIGLASAALLLANGKVAGISGILGGALFARGSDLSWRLAFLLGLPLGALGASVAMGNATSFAITQNPTLLGVAGLLVGIGTQLGNGCTSGHGVCGIARRSQRSIVATATFMTAGAITVFVVRHLMQGAP